METFMQIGALPGYEIDAPSTPLDRNPSRLPGRAVDERRRGQSMVELALFLPIIMLILLVAADFGRALAATISLSNAATLAAQYASSVYNPNHGASLSCANSTIQSLVAPEFAWGTSAPTVSLTTSTQTGPAYSGEQEVSATVAYSFTFITPVLNALKRSPLSETAADPLQASLPLTTTTPSEPAPGSVTVLHNQGTSPDTYDEVDWSFAASPPASLPLTVSQVFTLTTGITSTYTGNFVVFQSDPGSTTPAPNGCPVAYPSITTATGPYSVTLDNPTGITNYTYWVGVIPPHPAAYYDASIGPVTKSP